MRKFLMSLSAAGMLIVAPAALPSAATAAPNPGLEFCQEVIGPAPQPRNLGTLGQCTSIFTAPSDEGFVTLRCTLWLERDQLEDHGYFTYDECVKGEHDAL